MNALRLLITCLVLVSCGAPDGGQVGQVGEANKTTVKIATWNIEHLREHDGDGKRSRTAGDFQQLAEIASQLDADIIAVQEAESVEAIARVFSPEEYQFFISNRVDRRGAPIRTGFAVRKSLKAWKNGDYGYLDVGGRGDLRYGVDISVEAGEETIRLMSVHLKSFCFESNDPLESTHCRKRLAQTEPLENWIDKRAIEGDTFIVLGDFNRRYDASGEMEWFELDDGEPVGADLTRVTKGYEQKCNGGRYRVFIDHIIFGKKAADIQVPSSFQEQTFDNVVASDGKPPSDHCPQSVRLSLQ